MRLLTKGRASLAALVAAGVLALFAPVASASKVEKDLPGAMTVTDEAGIFSAEAKRSASDKMGAAKFNRGLHFHVDTHKSAPADIQAKLKGGDKDRVMKDWAKSLAVGDKAKGPFVLICMNPGYTEVILDEETLNRGFNQSNINELHSIFNSALLESGKKPAAERAPIRDAALLKATDYVINDLRGTKVVHTDGTPVGSAGTKAGEPAKKASTGMGIGGWICIGLVVLLAIWLVVGIIRALTAPSYGGGYGGGPGYGGGGGGFGFGTALLGGMFGAMAGMYLYNTMMGTSYPPQAFGGEATASDATGDTGDTGAGDYDNGGSAGGGGDYGGGDDAGGGGDYGGGGGDYGGGGGDYGGGGGDYGGGGGDYGGGGDFGGGDYGGGGDF